MQKNIQKAQKKKEIKEERRKKLAELELKFFKKVYFDVFTQLPSLFKNNNLTFENFTFEFGEKIKLIIDTKDPKPSYYILLDKITKMITQKYPVEPNLNPLQMKRVKLIQKSEDDWAVVSKYKEELYKEEERKKLLEIAQNMKKYYDDLQQQEIDKKNYSTEQEVKKRKEKEKKLAEEREKLYKEKYENDVKIKQLLSNEKALQLLNKQQIKNELDNEKIKKEYLKEVLEQNENLSNENKSIVKMKIDNLTRMQNNSIYAFKRANIENEIKSNEISALVDKIIANRQKEKMLSPLGNPEPKNYDVDEIPGVDKDLEERVNNILKKKKFTIESSTNLQKVNINNK